MSENCPTCRTFAEENHKQHLEIAGLQAKLIQLVNAEMALRRLLADERKAEPLARDITAILKLWRALCVPTARGRARVCIEPTSSRATIVRAALKHHTTGTRKQRRRICMDAVRGLALRPYVVNAQRKATGPEQQRYTDIDHALGGDKTASKRIEEHAEFYRLAQTKPLEWQERAKDAAFDVALHYLGLYQDAMYRDGLQRRRELLTANPLELGAVATRTGFTVGQIQAAVAGEVVPSTERPALFVVPNPDQEAA